MKLSDCNPGDMVVVDLGGEYVFVYLGNLLGERIKGKNTALRNWNLALVDLVDPDRLEVIPHTWHGLPPDTEVVTVVETIGRRRLMSSKRYNPDAGTDVDPMISGGRGGRF